MTQVTSEKTGAVYFDWIVLTAGAAALSLALWDGLAGGIGSARPEQHARWGPISAPPAMAAPERVFDFSRYAFLTHSGGTPGWQRAVAGFHLDEDFYGWLISDHANALDPRNSQEMRAGFSDDYAITYAAALARGLDLSAHPHPDDLRAVLVDEFGL